MGKAVAGVNCRIGCPREDGGFAWWPLCFQLPRT